MLFVTCVHIEINASCKKDPDVRDTFFPFHLTRAPFMVIKWILLFDIIYLMVKWNLCMQKFRHSNSILKVDELLWKLSQLHLYRGWKIYSYWNISYKSTLHFSTSVICLFFMHRYPQVKDILSRKTSNGRLKSTQLLEIKLLCVCILLHMTMPYKANPGSGYLL